MRGPVNKSHVFASLDLKPKSSLSLPPLTNRMPSFTFVALLLNFPCAGD